jgi:hypothetical protein
MIPNGPTIVKGFIGGLLDDRKFFSLRISSPVMTHDDDVFGTTFASRAKLTLRTLYARAAFLTCWTNCFRRQCTFGNLTDAEGPETRAVSLTYICHTVGASHTPLRQVGVCAPLVRVP